jgi:hypothetical protein
MRTHGQELPGAARLVDGLELRTTTLGLTLTG